MGRSAAVTLAVTAGVFLVLWLVSLRLRNASIVDVWWGPGFALIALVSFVLAPDGPLPRHLLVLILTTIWGLRLGIHLLVRNAGRGEDFRYAAMRKHWGDRFPLKSLTTVFLLQAVLMWVVSLPVQVAIHGQTPATLGACDLLGVLVFAIGLFFEAVGDAQLARFKADPANAGRVMDRGLWRYTRHPNYFGDAVAWWGLWLIALAVPGGFWSIVGPITMTVLLTRVSGVPMLERTIGRRRPGYDAYVRRTSAFVPRPPRL
jgi:steroid 5-alpha reductase family enzyme